MPQIGPLEILVVGVVALIVFGPQRLPDIARTIGSTLTSLRRMASEVKTEFASGLNADDVAEPVDEDDEAPAGDRAAP